MDEEWRLYRWFIICVFTALGMSKATYPLYAQSSNNSVKEEVGQYYDLSLEYIAERRYDSAQHWAQQILAHLSASTHTIEDTMLLKAHLLCAQLATEMGSDSLLGVHLPSAKRLLRTTNLPDHGKWWYELGYIHFLLSEIDSAIYFYDQAAIMAEKGESRSLALQALMGKAALLNTKDQQKEALKTLRHALQLAESSENAQVRFEALNQLATIHYSFGNLDSALSYFERLIKEIKETGNQQALISNLLQVGKMFLLQGQYQHAQTYLQQSLTLSEQLGDSVMILGVVTDISENYLGQSNWQKTAEYAQRGLELTTSIASKGMNFAHLRAKNLYHLGKAYHGLSQPILAQNAYEEALEIQQKALNNPTEAAKIQLSLGELLKSNADYSTALFYLTDALTLRTKLNDRLGMLDTQLLMANIYLTQGKYSLAIRTLKNCEVLSNSLDSYSGKAHTYELMAQAYSKLSRFKQAFTYQQLMGKYQDSMFNEQSAQIIHDLETKYQTEQKERQNAELAAELSQSEMIIQKDKARLLEKNQQNIGLIVGVLSLSFLLFFLYDRNKKQRQIMDQRMETLKKETEAQRLRAIITGEENERKRMARELHDGLGSLLASVKVLFSAVQNEKPDIIHSGHYHKADQLLDQACHEVREISHNMMPSTLDQDGLSVAIQDLCKIMNQANEVNITFIEFGLEESLSHDIQIYVYRMIQELIRNIVKHAQAQEAIVQLIKEDQLLLLTVEDDGKGFDPEKIAKDKDRGIGLTNIESRVQFLQGKLDLNAEPGKGCAVHIEIPIT